MDGVCDAREVFVTWLTSAWGMTGDESMSMGPKRARGVARSSGACRCAETTMNAIYIHGHGGQRLGKKDTVQGTESRASAVSNGSAATRQRVGEAGPVPARLSSTLQQDGMREKRRTSPAATSQIGSITRAVSSGVRDE